ncbi:helix-hairpin-helix domain-containing protein [Pedobacter nyackensis]|uniref:ComEA family DNA-binding protein n=1 Tax=Pedobacter nyackensis TaxID=475255 RepID=UPI00292D301B|nr:helix-hairpin-helix domain-containing protein [Pedobacter nyackensis]
MRFLCLLFWLHCNLAANAQEDDKIKDVIEAVTAHNLDDEDLSELSERLTNLRRHPINLNKATPEQLKSLFLLSPLQISNFFAYRAKTKFMDPLELQAIPGFDIQTINSILPFVTSANLRDYEGLKFHDMLNAANHDLILRYSSLMQRQKGFNDLPGSKYLGTPEKLLFRYRYNYQQIVSAALVMEKDAGEQLFNRKTGTDHISAHLALFKLGRIEKLVIGDYSMQFGQGLTLWSGFAFGKGPDVTSVAARDIAIKPYTSANESTFFRGLASTLSLKKNIYLSPFISYRRLDASLKALPDGTFSLSNINISGLHRTQTELKNQRSLLQKVYGGVLQYLTDNISIGIIGYQSHYEHQFVTGTQDYNKHSFKGKKLTNTGIYYNYTLRNIYLYGEIGHSINSGKAMINGAMASLSPKISLVVLHRGYAIDYHSFFSRAIGEGTEANNENGWYTGLNYSLMRNLVLSAYVDLFRFPWLKYRVDAPSAGHEVLGQLIYTKGKKFKATIRFKTEQKQQNPDTEYKDNNLDLVNKENYRLEWNWKINQKINFNQRTEITKYQKGINKKEIGYMSYLDFSHTPLSSKISANIRLAFFNTPSYNSRIYAYENNVLYASGSGVYSGKGFRTFINARYKLSKKLDIWGRYALFSYQDTETIGSGLEEIEGNIKSDVKLQIRYQF